MAAPLTARIAGFVDHLRLNGYVAGPSETVAVLDMLAHETLPPIGTVRRRMKTMLAGSRDEWERFDDLFEAYWVAAGRERTAFRDEARSSVRRPPKQERLWQRHLEQANTATGGETPQIESEGDDAVAGDASGRLVASHHGVNRKTDFKNIIDPEEIRAAEELAFRLASAMRYRLSRRYRHDPRGQRIDIRRTIRASLSHGGEPLDLRLRSAPDRPVRIVVFLDVSGSMKHYSRFFLQFVKGLVSKWLQSDAYLFHTRLVRVTETIRDANMARAMTRLALMAEGFGGGTKLGESLKTFNERYAKQAVNSRTVALILSDGYDTGTPEELAAQLAVLKKRVRRLVWLNPLLGWRAYEPVTRAMQAAMPFIDHFAAANTLESLAALEPELARL
jgi:uncharacterized protein with von Willebrand factor type A (vWA) domain